jgi:hypothetical protein
VLCTKKGRKADEIEITPEMIAVGASEIEKYPSGDYEPSFVAEKVFRAMLHHLVHRQER